MGCYALKWIRLDATVNLNRLVAKSHRLNQQQMCHPISHIHLKPHRRHACMPSVQRYLFVFECLRELISLHMYILYFMELRVATRARPPPPQFSYTWRNVERLAVRRQHLVQLYESVPATLLSISHGDVPGQQLSTLRRGAPFSATHTHTYTYTSDKTMMSLNLTKQRSWSGCPCGTWK